MRRAGTCTPVRAALLVLAGMCIAPPAAAQNSQWIIEVQDNRFKGVKGFSKFETMVTVRGSPPPGTPAMPSPPGLSVATNVGVARSQKVFGLRVFKENGVSDEKLLYAGNVLAQLLDNDADGKVDNKKVWQRLKKIYGEKIKGKRPMLFIPIFKDFNSPAERDLFQLDIQVGAVLCK